MPGPCWGACYRGYVLSEQLGRGSYLHGRSSWHRDLKPANILLTPTGRPLLLDFNLADQNEPWDGRLAGTLAYMAPEQLEPAASATAPTRDQRARSDLFALGVVLYQLLTGKHPFGPVFEDRDPEVVRACLRERQREGPPPLCAANPQVDRRLARLLESCLAWRPEERPASARQLANGLHALVVKRPSRRQRWAWAAALLVLAAEATVAALKMAAPGVSQPAAVVPNLMDARALLNAGVEAYRTRDYELATQRLTLPRYS